MCRKIPRWNLGWVCISQTIEVNSRNSCWNSKIIPQAMGNSNIQHWRMAKENSKKFLNKLFLLLLLYSAKFFHVENSLLHSSVAKKMTERLRFDKVELSWVICYQQQKLMNNFPYFKLCRISFRILLWFQLVINLSHFLHCWACSPRENNAEHEICV